MAFGHGRYQCTHVVQKFIDAVPKARPVLGTARWAGTIGLYV